MSESLDLISLSDFGFLKKPSLRRSSVKLATVTLSPDFLDALALRAGASAAFTLISLIRLRFLQVLPSSSTLTPSGASMCAFAISILRYCFGKSVP